MDPNGPQCGCSQKGCLEMYASAGNVARIAKELANADGAESSLRGKGTGRVLIFTTGAVWMRRRDSAVPWARVGVGQLRCILYALPIVSSTTQGERFAHHVDVALTRPLQRALGPRRCLKLRRQETRSLWPLLTRRATSSAWPASTFADFSTQNSLSSLAVRIILGLGSLCVIYASNSSPSLSLFGRVLVYMRTCWCTIREAPLHSDTYARLPRLFALHAGMTLAGDFLFDKLRASYNKYAWTKLPNNVKVRTQCLSFLCTRWAKGCVPLSGAATQ